MHDFEWTGNRWQMLILQMMTKAILFLEMLFVVVSSLHCIIVIDNVGNSISTSN